MFKVGDRVYVKEGAGLSINNYGRIVHKGFGVPPIGIEFDDFLDTHSRHDCEGHGEMGKCRYVYPNEVVLENIYKSKLFKLLQENE